MSLFWWMLTAIAVVMVVPPFRRNLFTRYLFNSLKRKIPEISATEQEAIDAGSVWWEQSLFRGKPRWDQLHDLPVPRLSAEEDAFLNGPVDQLCSMVDDWQINRRGDLPPEVWDFIRQQRFFGMAVPKHYGGLEFSALAHSAVVQKIASRSVSTAVTVMVPNSLGPAELLLHYGTEAQREYYLPRLAAGEEIPCFALTSPYAGSDAGSIPDRGEVVQVEEEGEPVLKIRLSFNKRYITLAPAATLIGLAFQLFDPNRLLGREKNVGITVALIPATHPGVEIGRRHDPLNTPFLNGPVCGEGVEIPLEWVVGGEQQVGKGWRMLMESLAAGRSISLPALSTGAAKLTTEVVSSYSMVREQFGIPIGYFEGVSERIAQIAISTYRMDAVRRLNAQAVDLGERPSVLSAIAKYNLTESMRQVINDGMDVLGGKGIVLGPNNLLGHPYRAIPISITVEGANILTRSMIVFGQGAIRSHPWLLKEIEAIHGGVYREALHRFDRVLFSHVGSLICELNRAFWLNLTNGYFSHRPGGVSLPGIYRQVNRLSAAYAVAADLALIVLGGEMKRLETISGRFADGLSGLYQLSAMLKLYHDRGELRGEQALVRAACEHEMARVEQALDGVIRNFPFYSIRLLLRLFVLPFGIRQHGPGDHLLHKVARRVTRRGELRGRMVCGIYRPDSEREPLVDLEEAVVAAEACASTRRKLKRHFGSRAGRPARLPALIEQAVAQSLIDQGEADKVNHWLELHNRVIAVDDFDAGAFSYG